MCRLKYDTGNCTGEEMNLDNREYLPKNKIINVVSLTLKNIIIMWLKGSEFKGENSCLDIVLLNCGCDCLGSCVCCYSVELAVQSRLFNTLN